MTACRPCTWEEALFAVASKLRSTPSNEMAALAGDLCDTGIWSVFFFQIIYIGDMIQGGSGGVVVCSTLICRAVCDFKFSAETNKFFNDCWWYLLNRCWLDCRAKNSDCLSASHCGLASTHGQPVKQSLVLKALSLRPRMSLCLFWRLMCEVSSSRLGGLL